MPSSRIKLTGIALVCTGAIVLGLWILWVTTRSQTPVDMPVSMTVGHIRTPEFRINRNALYTIDIEVEKTIPFDTLSCLLGMSMGHTSTAFEECPDRPSVVKASWLLTSNGQTIGRGYSDDYISGAWMNDSIARELGHFDGKSGSSYVLDVNVLADGSLLASGNPRLKVEIDPEFVEGDMFWSAILFLLTGTVAVVGLALLAVSAVKNRRSRNVMSNA